MKTRLIIALFLLGIVQSFAHRKFTPGIRAGLTMSTVATTDGDYRTNFYVGLQLPLNLTKSYSLQPEFNYSRQGVNNIEYYDYRLMESRNTNLSLDYIDFNLINKFKIGRVNLQAGPGLAFLVNASEPYLEEVDYTFNFGVGIQLTKRLSVEARWQPGLSDIESGLFTSSSDDDGSHFKYGYMRNNVFQIGCTFRF